MTNLDPLLAKSTLADFARIFTTAGIDPILVRVTLDPDAYDCLRSALGMDVAGESDAWFQVDGIAYERR